MEIQGVAPSELQSVEGGFNWGAAAAVGYHTAEATGSVAAALVAGVAAGLVG
jgi:hypothetical protein